MRTNATPVKLTKLANAGIVSSIKKTVLPWLTKNVWPWGKYVGTAALAAPALTYGINRLKGYSPDKPQQQMQLTPDNIVDFIRNNRMENPLELGLKGLQNYRQRG